MAINSMTGFARSETQFNDQTYIWEIRSVNHRYLDIQLKLPERLRQHEQAFRNAIGSTFNRGRVELILKTEHQTEYINVPELNLDVVRKLGQLSDTIQQLTPKSAAISVVDILKWPGTVAAPDIDESSRLSNLKESLQSALTQLQHMRQDEGTALSQLLIQRAQQCLEYINALKNDLGDINQQYQQRWQSKLEQLPQGTDIEESRIYQEIALLLNKSDISEELDRLDVHLHEIINILKNKNDKPVGRRLDFLIQELNRESNTLGSKSIDIRITNTSVELKVLIEQMREQVQNIE